MLVIKDREKVVKLYLHEFGDAIQLMATNGAENCILLTFTKSAHRVYRVNDISEAMGFARNQSGALIIE